MTATLSAPTDSTPSDATPSDATSTHAPLSGSRDMSDAPPAAGNALDTRYSDGDYLEANPTFHVERAAFKTDHILRMCRKHQLAPSSLVDVGCGAGEVTRLLAEAFPAANPVHGFELSPQGIAMCREREAAVGERLQFFHDRVDNPPPEGPRHEGRYDLLVSCDVFEHVEDPFAFLRSLLPVARDYLFHIPLDMTAQMVVRGGAMRRVRNKLGHLHYFSKETALALLEDCGYEVVDDAYTPAALHGPRNLRQRLAKLPRQLASAVAPDLSVRLFGGYSMLAYVRPVTS